MKVLSYVSLVSLLLMVLTAGVLAQELSKEEWQKQITELTSKRNDLAGKLSSLKNEVENLQKQDADKAAALKLCQDELLAMTGATADQIAAYEANLKNIDSKLSDLSRLSNQDLWSRRGELDEAQKMIDEAKKNKLSAVPKYYDQLADFERRLVTACGTLPRRRRSMITRFSGQRSTRAIATESRMPT